MRKRFSLLALAFAAASSIATNAGAVVVERVVAVIGDKPILQSEVRERSLPFIAQIEAKVPDGPQRNAAVSQMDKELVMNMVNESLIAQAAERSHITVTSEELENALHNIAASQGFAVEELFRQARVHAFMTEQNYRDEIRRQVLEGKMLQLRIRGRARITEEDLKQRYDAAIKEEKQKEREYHPAWIVIRVIPGSSPEAESERQQLAEALVARARKGEDFASLAKKYSDDTGTRDDGGDLGVKAPSASAAVQQGKRTALSAELEAAVLPLEAGQVANPVRAGQNIIIMKLIDRAPSILPPYEKARPQIMQLKQQEIMIHEKKKWIDELKVHTHVVIRM